MKISILLCIAFFFFLNNPAIAQKNSISSSQLNNQQIALITAVVIKGNSVFITTDFVQMLTGKSAIAAAKKTGEAEYDINKKKDTVWYVPNDYFVVNINKTLRQLQLTSDAVIYLVKEGGSTLVKSTIARLKNNFEGKLFKIHLLKNSIIKIEEIYTP